MKVYGKLGFVLGVHGQVRKVVTCRSQKEAAALFGCSVYEMSTYGSQTWNEREVEVATAKPGTVFYCEDHLRDGEWKEVPTP